MVDQSKDNDKKVDKANKEEDIENYGYEFFQERHGKPDKTFVSKLFEGRKAANAFKCVTNAYWCTQNSPMVKLLMGAMKSHGCPVDLQRHVSCENCLSRVNGGYDPINNQVVICQNNSSSKGVCCSVMGHELTHMFDNCRAKMDFTNLEHLACTEIRAANFFHCSFSSGWAHGDHSLLDWKNKHRECVKRKALMSVMMVRNVDHDKVKDIVDKVFERCYNDLEPFGRHLRPKSRDPERALHEGYLYGYSDR